MNTHTRIGGRWRARPGRAGAVGVIVALVLIAGLGVAGWAVYRSLTGTPSAAPGGALGPSVAGPAAYEVTTRAAALHEQEGRVEEAEAVLRGAVEQFADDQDLRLALGEFLVRHERFAEAYDEYVAALAIGPREASIEFRAGMMASLGDRYERAIEHYTAAQQADPGEVSYPLYLGGSLLQLGRLDEARAALVRATVLDESNPTAWGSLAEVALRGNEAGLAEQHARRAVELQPEQGAWKLLLARAIKRQGDAEGALAILVALPQEAQDGPEYVRTIAECLAMVDRPEDAADRYERAARRRPENAQLAYDAAVWADRVGRADRAMGLAQRAQSLGHERAGQLVTRLSSADATGGTSGGP